MFDATVILGGGLLDSRQLSASTKSRLDAALDVYQGETLIVVGAGPTKSPPPLDSRGFPVFESVGAVRYLLHQGVPSSRVLYETSSYDTIGNAYFCRVIHTDPSGMLRLRIITSAFHLPRTEIIFQWVYGLDAIRPYELDFLAAPDNHFAAERLARHIEKEQSRITDIRVLQQSIHSLAALHRWMFANHAAYCAHLQPIGMTGSAEEGSELLLHNE